MKIAFITDTHAGARNDSLIFNEYFISFYRDIFFPYLRKNKINTIIHLGDVFDRRKYVNFLTLNSWRRNVFNVLNDEFTSYIIQGNHDIYHRETNEIDSLGELFLSYKNIHIINQPTEMKFDDLNFLMIPWIQKENEAECKEKIKKSSAKILLGHFDIIGFDFHRGITNTEIGFNPKDLERFECVYSGHYHHRSNKDNIYYLGSPYEIDWNDVDDPRGFHVFDTDNHKMDFILNPYKMHNKIVYSDDTDIKSLNLEQYKNNQIKIIIRKKENQLLFDTFIEKLNKSGAADVSIIEEGVEKITASDTIDETKDTLTILLEYVKTFDIDDKNKQSLGVVLTQIYKEANELET